MTHESKYRECSNLINKHGDHLITDKTSGNIKIVNMVRGEDRLLFIDNLITDSTIKRIGSEFGELCFYVGKSGMRQKTPIRGTDH